MAKGVSLEGRQFSVSLNDPDWRPDNHVFTEAEMRDRFMRFGGMDAMTAWRAVGFIRDWYEYIDWDTLIDASVLGHAHA